MTTTVTSRETSTSPSNTVDTVDAVVIGAGIAGLYMLHKLRGLGLSVRVLEAAPEIGGTWYWNRYPGARVDVEGVNYSYSFSEELQQEWQWSERYPPQAELLSYLNHVADRFDLRRDIELNTRLEKAIFAERKGRWSITTDRGHVLSIEFLIMATGCLSAAKIPEIPGLASFKGRTYHTGHWPQHDVDFAGQRVAVIGTGSSGIQIIPHIAAQAAHLTVFQRTPNFSLPARNAPVDQEASQKVKGAYRAHRELARQSGFGVPIEEPTLSALEVQNRERRKRFETAWWSGSLVGLMASYNDLYTDAQANQTAAEFVRGKIREIVQDPVVAETLCPVDYPIGTKRPCLDTDYYATYNRDNVELVNLRQNPIREITARGIRTEDADLTFDSIVFATGFDAMTGALTSIDICGRDGLLLRDKWASGPKTYLGLQSVGFPNLFLITGPGSPSVISNMVVSIEQHVEWIADCIDHLRRTGLGPIEPTAEAEEDWVEHVRQVAAATLYPQANSWYMGANVPGKPQVFMPYLGGVGAYRNKCSEVALNGYEGFVVSARPLEAPERET